MATITPTYVYTDGAAFDISGHNENVYSETSGRGVMSESNGGLEVANLNGSFQIRDYHVWPEEAVRPRTDGTREAVDYFSINVQQAESDDWDVRNVASCGVRFYIPFSGIILFNVGFFVNYFRPYFGDSQEAGPDNPYGRIRYWLVMNDNTQIAATVRRLPCSAYINVGSNALEVREAACAFHVNMHHFHRNASPGWYDIQLKVQVENDTSNQSADIVRSVPGNASTKNKSETYTHDVYNRVTFGVRNPTALALMS